MTLEIGDMNRTNKRGPKTEPCGTPVGDGVREEDDVSTLTWDERWGQVWMNPGNHVTRQAKSMLKVYGVEWHGQEVSKAADMSRAARIEILPWSMESNMSLVSFSSAVSVGMEFSVGGLQRGKN